MAKKEFKNAAKDVNLREALLENTGQVVSQKREKQELANAQDKTLDTSWVRFTVICAEELVQKIRFIAREEDFSIREVIEKSFSKTIASYESKRGKKIVIKNKKKDIDSVL